MKRLKTIISSIAFIALYGNCWMNPLYGQTPQYRTVSGQVQAATTAGTAIKGAKVSYSRVNNPLPIATKYSLQDGKFELKVTVDQQLKSILLQAVASGYEPMRAPKTIDFNSSSNSTITHNLKLQPINRQAKAEENMRSQNPEFFKPKIIPPSPIQKPKPDNPVMPPVDKREKSSSLTGEVSIDVSVRLSDSLLSVAVSVHAFSNDVTVKLELASETVKKFVENEDVQKIIAVPPAKRTRTAEEIFTTALENILIGNEDSAMALLNELLTSNSFTLSSKLAADASIEMADLLVRRNRPYNAITHLDNAISNLTKESPWNDEKIAYSYFKKAVALKMSMVDTGKVSQRFLHKADSVLTRIAGFNGSNSPRLRKLRHLLELERTKNLTSEWEDSRNKRARRKGVKQNKVALAALDEAYVRENNAYKGILIVEHADIFQKLHKHRKALKLYNRALAINEDIYESGFHPDMIQSHLGAALSFSDLGKSNKAMEHLLKARTLAISNYPEFDPLLAKLYYWEALRRQSIMPRKTPFEPLELMQHQNERLSQVDSLFERSITAAQINLSNSTDTALIMEMRWLKICGLLGWVNALTAEYQYHKMKNNELLRLRDEPEKFAARMKLLLGNYGYENRERTVDFSPEYKKHQMLIDSLITSAVRELNNYENLIDHRNQTIEEELVLETVRSEINMYHDGQKLFAASDRNRGIGERRLYHLTDKNSSGRLTRSGYLKELNDVGNRELVRLYSKRILPWADKLVKGENVPAEFLYYHNYFHPNDELPITQFQFGK